MLKKTTAENLTWQAAPKRTSRQMPADSNSRNAIAKKLRPKVPTKYNAHEITSNPSSKACTEALAPAQQTSIASGATSQAVTTATPTRQTLIAAKMQTQNK
jgi:hypothetical protein